MNFFIRTAVIMQLLCFVVVAQAQCDSLLYRKFQKLPADTILSIQTYDGSGQLMHPDILFIDDTTGGIFYLIATPYPEYNDKLENPSLYKSFDGLNFFEPVTGLNPLVPVPAYDHNDDPDMWFDTVKNVLNIQYLETMRPDSQNLIILTGKIGDKLEKKTLIHFDLKKKKKFIVSPSMVNTGKEGNVLFYVSKDFDKKGNNRVEFLVEKKGRWKMKHFKVPIVATPLGFTPWHVDVVRNGDTYYMLLNGFWGKEPVWGEKDINKYTLLLATTNDIKKWNVSPLNVVDCLTFPDKECQYIYRSTALISGNIMAIWYSYVTMENVWKIGLKKVVLTN